MRCPKAEIVVEIFRATLYSLVWGRHVGGPLRVGTKPGVGHGLGHGVGHGVGHGLPVVNKVKKKIVKKIDKNQNK